MQRFLERHEIRYLKQWAAQRPRKPLLVRGARQVGKSTLVREFARSARMPLLEVNFERNPEFREAFAAKDPARILDILALLTGRTLSAGTDLLFLDEIQDAPEALTALRYFCEEMPELHVAAAGSLVEFALGDRRLPMPVGRVEYLHLGPMAFEDFLIALGHGQLAAHLRGFSLADLRRDAFPNAVHKKCLELLQRFFLIGGLPEAVSAYAQDEEALYGLERVARVQHSLVATYRDDFNKYSHGGLKNCIQLMFDRLPGMVGRKFKYVRVSREHRSKELADALQQLCMARVACKVHRTAANGLPLAAEASERYFKCLCLDVGLMCAALQFNLLDLGKRDLTLVNKGAVAEQFVGQQLLCSGPRHETPALHYWVRGARSSAAEIDYALAIGQRIVPVEVKAGATGSLKSLHQFLREKRSDFALRFNAELPSLLRDSKKLPDGALIHYRLLSLPLYLAGQARRLAGELLAGAHSMSNVTPCAKGSAKP